MFFSYCMHAWILRLMKCWTTNDIHICGIERGNTTTGFPGVQFIIYSNSLLRIGKLKKLWIILHELDAYALKCEHMKSYFIWRTECQKNVNLQVVALTDVATLNWFELTVWLSGWEKIFLRRKSCFIWNITHLSPSYNYDALHVIHCHGAFLFIFIFHWSQSCLLFSSCISVNSAQYNEY